MSATLTWASSGLATKVGTTVADCFTDLKNKIDSNSGDATFFWEVKGSNLGSTPYYLSIGRKDGSAGRIAIICWTSAPAGNNSAILDTSPTSNAMYIAWFPNGTGTTLSNLTASSGTIAGDDTNCVKVSISAAFNSLYGASMQWFYFDSAEGMVFCAQNPASGTTYVLGAGDLVVDAADSAYGCTFGSGSSGNFATFFSSSLWAWSGSAVSAGAATPCLRTNYGSANRTYFQPQTGFSGWISQTAGATNDILQDNATTYAWFFPQPLVANAIKGGGFPLKLRQIAGGPTTNSALFTYSTTGPVVQARQMYAGTTGSTQGSPYIVNFKV